MSTNASCFVVKEKKNNRAIQKKTEKLKQGRNVEGYEMHFYQCMDHK